MNQSKDKKTYGDCYDCERRKRCLEKHRKTKCMDYRKEGSMSAKSTYDRRGRMER